MIGIADTGWSSWSLDMAAVVLEEEDESIIKKEYDGFK